MDIKSEEKRKKITRVILITITVLFIGIMLIIPLFSILFSALKGRIGILSAGNFHEVCKERPWCNTSCHGYCSDC